MRKLLLAASAALVLTGCGQQEQEAKAPPLPANSEFGRFKLYAAGSNQAGQFFAWRLDTKTGYLNFCYYDPGGMAGPTKPIQPMLNCLASDAYSGPD